MADSTGAGHVRVTRHFDASAERVYEGFLDPARAGKFLFATALGHIVRCDIDARVGGAFTIVDRRSGEDVTHTGKYLELDRPRRIVFAFTVDRYSTDPATVTIDIVPTQPGCELALTQDLKIGDPALQQRTRDGWTDILDVAAELLVDDVPTCGIGVARHATIPAQLAAMFDGLAETLDLHRRMLKLDDPHARTEDEVYRELAAAWKQVAGTVNHAATLMAAQRELPMGAHDETAWDSEHLRAFEAFVTAQTRVLGLLRVAAERDEQMLALMRAP